MIVIRGGRTDRARAVLERADCQRRLSRLSQELADLSPRSAEDKILRDDIRAAIGRVFATMTACDKLLGPSDPTLPPIPPSIDLDEPNARQARMSMMLRELRDLPQSCQAAASALRRAIAAELRGPSVGRIAHDPTKRRS